MMQGLLRVSHRRLASYRDGKSFTDAYQLLITKKPVEYDYVAIDVNSFVGGAQRLTKNVTTEQRRNREISRHVLNAIQQLLRRVVCRHALLLAFDGAGASANVYHFRRANSTRRIDTLRQRLPGFALARGVEERVVKAMPLPRGLIPREVVVSGTSVEGSVERKVAAWALDLACRDGTTQHTSRSICVIGSYTLWQTMLGLTPYFHGTHVVHGSADLKHMTVNDTLAWLELNATGQGGDDTHAVATGRTDALLLTLLGMGCELTELAALPGANFTVIMDAYHRCRRVGGVAPISSASIEHKTEKTSGAGSSMSSSGSAGAPPPFQLLHELPGAVVEVDLLALLVLFLPEQDAAAAVAELTSGAAIPFPSRAAPLPAGTTTPGGVFSLSHSEASHPLRLTFSHEEVREAVVRGQAQCVPHESYLAHLLSTHYLLCYGETTAGLLRVPAYFAFATDKTERRGNLTVTSVGRGKSTFSGGREGQESALSVAEWVRFLRISIQRGRRYCVVPTPPTASPSTALTSTTTTEETSKVEESSSAPNASAALTTSSATAAASALPYYPFWTAGQPWTAAEYTVLCHTAVVLIEAALREYIPGLMHKVNPELLRDLASSRWSVDEARGVLQRLFAYADVENPHPSLCFGPSYCWTQNEKSRMWQMRYVDLGTRAKEMDLRHTRSLLSGVRLSQQTQSEEGAMLFDATAQSWAVQSTFPIASAPSSSPPAASAPASSSDDASSVTELAERGTAAQTLKVLTWNVMFDRYSGQPTPLGMPGIDWCTPKRYPVLAKIIAAEDADVVGMQEVELPFAEYLAAQPWCRERYILSCSPRSSILDPWGVLLLVKRGRHAWPVQQLTHLNVPAWSGHVSLMPVVTLDLSSRNINSNSGSGSSGTAARVSHAGHDRTARLLNVCSMHLLAPYLKAHETARTGQDQALRTCLTRQLHGDTIVMGDFNDWPSNEFSMPAETRYVECWPLVHPGDYGKTMDESNTFCKMKIEELFFGRSDKVFLRTGGGAGKAAAPLLKPVEAHLVGTRSVNAENDNTDAPAYLFPSDHYGVSMTFEVLPRHM